MQRLSQLTCEQSTLKPHCKEVLPRKETMSKTPYNRLWHGSRSAYYLRKAKHVLSRPFYPLMKWKHYGYSDEGENDAAWAAKLEAMNSWQSLPSISVTDFDISCFQSVDQVLSEAASRRESLTFSQVSCSTATIAELEDTQVLRESKLACQTVVSVPQPKFRATRAQLDDLIGLWLDPSDPMMPTHGFRKACPIANFHLLKMISPNRQADREFSQRYFKARTALFETLIADQTGDKMIMNHQLESTLSKLEDWFRRDSYPHLLKLWPLCQGHLGAWCTGVNAYVHQPDLFVVRLPHRGGKRSRKGAGRRSSRINNLYSGGVVIRSGRRALGLSRPRCFSCRP